MEVRSGWLPPTTRCDSRVLRVCEKSERERWAREGERNAHRGWFEPREVGLELKRHQEKAVEIERQVLKLEGRSGRLADLVLVIPDRVPDVVWASPNGDSCTPRRGRRAAAKPRKKRANRADVVVVALQTTNS